MADRFLLVVEGIDDFHALSALLKHHNFQPRFKIEEQGGYESLVSRIAARLVPGSDLERLGILIDADLDCQTRWHSIRDRLRDSGYENVPDSPDPAGTLVEDSDRPRIGVWIMPNNTLPGMLEDFLAYLVAPEVLLWPRAIECVDEIPEANRPFSLNVRSKAVIHTWLAWQKEPGKPLGQAISNRCLRAESEHVTPLLSWLTRLFG